MPISLWRPAKRALGALDRCCPRLHREVPQAAHA